MASEDDGLTNAQFEQLGKSLINQLERANEKDADSDINYDTASQSLTRAQHSHNRALGSVKELSMILLDARLKQLLTDIRKMMTDNLLNDHALAPLLDKLDELARPVSTACHLLNCYQDWAVAIKPVLGVTDALKVEANDMFHLNETAAAFIRKQEDQQEATQQAARQAAAERKKLDEEEWAFIKYFERTFQSVLEIKNITRETSVQRSALMLIVPHLARLRRNAGQSLALKDMPTHAEVEKAIWTIYGKSDGEYKPANNTFGTMQGYFEELVYGERYDNDTSMGYLLIGTPINKNKRAVDPVTEKTNKKRRFN